MDDLIPCPNCERYFHDLDELYDHAFKTHGGGAMFKEITWDDFVQVDGQWICTIGNFTMSVAPDREGVFKLMVYGIVEPLPAATPYPSQPEKERVLEVANHFRVAYIASLKEDPL